LDIAEIKKLVQESYGFEILDIEKIKNVYKIKTFDNCLCLKVIRYNFNHFFFIVSAIKHLQNNGFERIPKFIKTVGNKEYIAFDNYFAYLTPWVNARICNYDNPLDLELAAAKLAELHKKSIGFEVDNRMQPRVGWFKWIDTFITRRDEILSFKTKIQIKEQKSEFDHLYLNMMEEELERAEMCVDNLCNSNYIAKMEKEILLKGFCHHDYAHHNVLIGDNGNVDIIDFDYSILDTHLHDLSSLLLRTMKHGKWDMDTAKYIMDVYNSIMPIDILDIPIMAAFMEFPQDYWQLGIQYYLENQPWEEEFFLKKLKKTYEDRDEKQEFVEEFREYIYKG
jgi:CotS family spore coat protein